MLSIRFKPDKEWWVSGKVFDRLFQAGLTSGRIPPQLERWRHVADANGGLSLTRMEASQADELSRALHETAKQELAQLENVDAASEAGTYRSSLVKLLQLG